MQRAALPAVAVCGIEGATMTKATCKVHAQKGTIKPLAVDWDAAKLEYVTTTCTLEAVADKFKVTGVALRRRARQEGWEQERAEYRSRFMQETTKAKIENAAVRLAQWNE